MQCKTCGRDNPAEAHFCAGCGAQLEDVAPPVPLEPDLSRSDGQVKKPTGLWRRYGWLIPGAVFAIAVIMVFIWLGRYAPQSVRPEIQPATVLPATALQTTALPATAPVSAAPQAATGFQIGNAAPDFTLPYLDGAKVSLAGFRGSPVVLNFWATWCGPCRNEMPYLQQIYNDWHGKGLVILEIDMGESAATVQKFLGDKGLSMPVLLDTSQSVSARYGIYAIPTTYFIDADGIIRACKIGSFSSKSEIENEINNLLRKAATTPETIAIPAPTPSSGLPSVPVLVAPSDGAILSQPTVAWSFVWTPASDPANGIKGYQLLVFRPESVLTLVDVQVTATSYSYTGRALEQLTGWAWKVRALNGAGQWSDWSAVRTLSIKADITPTVDVTPPTTPTPRYPASGAMLPQPGSPWTFDWDDSSDPESGVRGYQLRVYRTGSLVPLINAFVTGSTFTCTLGGYIPETERDGWVWQVIAVNGAGTWSNWTSWIPFGIQAASTTATETARAGSGALREHFSELGVGKMPAGWSGNPWDSLVKDVAVFQNGEQLALYVSVIKEVTISGGFYSAATGQQIGDDYPYRWYQTPSPRQLGLYKLGLTPGKYLYAIFADGVLVRAFPIEVR